MISAERKDSWIRWGIGSIGTVICFFISISYVIGKNEQRFISFEETLETTALEMSYCFEHAEGEREKLREDYKRTGELNARKGDIIASTAKDVQYLEDNFVELKSSLELSVRELKSDLNSRLDRMDTKTTENFNHLMTYLQSQ